VHAHSASGDEWASLVHEAGEEALLALLKIPNLGAVQVERRLDVPDLPANALSTAAENEKRNRTSNERRTESGRARRAGDA
jgi:hypothetical protein